MRRGRGRGLPHLEHLPGEEDVPPAARDYDAREGRQGGQGALEELPPKVRS